MKRALVIGFCLLGLTPLSIPAGDGGRKVEPSQHWEGILKKDVLVSVEEPLPEMVIIAEGLDELKPVWKQCRGKEKMPEIDFIKNIVVVVSSRDASDVHAILTLDDKGDLKVSSRRETGDSGTAYEIAVVPRTGFKTVNQKRVSCGRFWCDCYLSSLWNPNNEETEALHRKLEGVCWGDLSQYQCVKDNPLHHERMLDTAFADCAKQNKIMLYIANTGG
jgi:hypothetical protein